MRALVETHDAVVVAKDHRGTLLVQVPDNGECEIDVEGRVEWLSRW